jgi:hypothetical protein
VKLLSPEAFCESTRALASASAYVEARGPARASRSDDVSSRQTYMHALRRSNVV